MVSSKVNVPNITNEHNNESLIRNFLKYPEIHVEWFDFCH